MSARIFPVLMIFLLVSLTPGAKADPVADLYAAEVPVTDQSVSARADALVQAMGQVLVKATGSRSVLETSAARELMSNPSRYLQQYRYESLRPVPGVPESPRLALRAEFDGRAIERQLRAANLPLWGRERPLTLVWLAFSDNNRRQLLGAEAGSPAVEALRRAATRRGLPIEVPAMDTEDATRVSFMDVWGIYEEPLLAAAERYAPDAVMAGSIFRAGDDVWAGRWTLLRNGLRQRWEVSGASVEEVATAAVDALAEHYAGEFSVYAGEGQEQIVLEVTDVSALNGYASVLSYLSTLSAVGNVRLVAVNDALLRFELDLNGSTHAFRQAVAVGRVLEPLPEAETVIRLGEPVIEPLPEADTNDNSLAEPPPLRVEAPVLRYRYRG